MATVPKSLKFLKPHYESLVYLYETWTLDTRVKKKLAGILSVLAMSYGKEGKNESLHYRIKGPDEPAGLWGHDYVRYELFYVYMRCMLLTVRVVTSSTVTLHRALYLNTQT